MKMLHEMPRQAPVGGTPTRYALPGGLDDEAPHTSRCDGRAPRDTKAYTLLAPASNEGPAHVTIYLNLDSDEVYTEEEVMEWYDRDVAQLIADNPVPQGYRR